MHGGHSGQFCGHAVDSLEEIVQAYIAQGYAWVGLTEHMPPVNDHMVLPEEAAAGMDARANYERFADYIATCRRLQSTYASKITIYVGFETEVCGDYKPFLWQILQEFKPDYIVGSVHHVRDIMIDYTPEAYRRAADEVGGIEALYCEYFDIQYDLITTFQPSVVGHLDLIRLRDPDYPQRLTDVRIRQRIERNLGVIKELGLILDFNLRALAKGQDEPYLSQPILFRACEMGIPVVPGDDSHGIADIGLHWDEGIRILQEAGIDTRWSTPVC